MEERYATIVYDNRVDSAISLELNGNSIFITNFVYAGNINFFRNTYRQQHVCPYL